MAENIRNPLGNILTLMVFIHTHIVLMFKNL